jgi:hypothetical protein
MSKEAMKLALGKIKSARDCHPNAVNTLLFEAEEILEEALEKPDFWEGYVPEPVKPAQQEPFDCGVYLGSGKDHAIKHHVSYGPAQPVPDAFEQLMREADKPTQVPEGIAKYVDALIKGTHEITSLTIRPKRTWVGLTDDEIEKLTVELRDIPVTLAFAIEAKLKEKNT